MLIQLLTSDFAIRPLSRPMFFALPFFRIEVDWLAAVSVFPRRLYELPVLLIVRHQGLVDLADSTDQVSRRVVPGQLLAHSGSGWAPTAAHTILNMVQVDAMTMVVGHVPTSHTRSVARRPNVNYLLVTIVVDFLLHEVEHFVFVLRMLLSDDRGCSDCRHARQLVHQRLWASLIPWRIVEAPVRTSLLV